MKVVHLSYSDGGGGAGKAAYRLHRGLSEIGIDSMMIVSRKFNADSSVRDSGTPLGRLWSHTAGYLDLIPQRLFKPEHNGYNSCSWVGTGAVRRAKKFIPDIIQLHWINSGFMRVGELGVIDCPVVWRLADMWPMTGIEHYVSDNSRYIEGYTSGNRNEGTRYPDLSQWTWKRKSRNYKRIDNLTIVSPSTWLADCAKKSLLFRDRRVEVIPTGQNVHIYRPITKEVARKVLKLPQNGKYIMTSSLQLNDDRKGVDLFLSSISRLQGNGYRILFLGDGNLNFETPFECIRLGRLDDDVSLSLAYSAADVFVATPREENLPNTVIESMACGTPVVSFDVGGLPDLVRNGDTGFLVQAFDIERLAMAIDAILEDDGLRMGFSKNSRELIVKEFSTETQATRYAELYNDVLT